MNNIEEKVEEFKNLIVAELSASELRERIVEIYTMYLEQTDIIKKIEEILVIEKYL